jgi:hypothetical protein
MKISYLRKAGMTAVAGGLLFASGASPITYADDGNPQLLGFRQFGDLILITVFNPGHQVRSGTLVLEVMSEGRPTTMVVPFTVWEGQKVCVSVALPSSSSRPIQVGLIVDDGAPI